MTEFNLLSSSGFVTSLAAILTALGMKEILLDRFHRKDNIEDRNLKQLETLEALQKGYETNKKLIEDLGAAITKNANQIVQLSDSIDKISYSLDSLKALSTEGDLSLLRERLYYMYSAAIKCGFRTSVGYGISEKLFSCYTKLGGNSEIAALHDIYSALPVKQGSLELPKFEEGGEATDATKVHE